MKTLIAFLFAIAISTIAAPVSAQNFIKCKTINGTIIVVQGWICPPGTIFVGIA